jgi:site-specific DNA-methyltransferase (adenine-specific)
MVVAIEDAGFEIRDQIMWVYGSGFPKSLDVAKAINKAAGVEYKAKPASGVGFMNNNDDGYNTTLNQLVQVGESTDEAQEWQGWGTALKPAHEPIVMARKPVDGTVANNVLKHGVGGINIDASRVAYNGETPSGWFNETERKNAGFKLTAGSSSVVTSVPHEGRFPANFIHDGSEEVLALTGDAARFFYCAKASKAERNAGLEGMPERRPDERSEVGMGTFAEKGVAIQSNFHPTVKPLTLMRYLVRLVTPPNGTVLDPFAGSGSTLVAAILEGFSPVGMELTADYLPIINARVEWALNQEPDQPSLF